MMHFNIKSRENTIYPLYIKPCETNMMLDSCQNRKNLCVLHYVCCLLCIFWYDIYDVTPSLFIYIILLLLLFMLYPMYVFVCVCIFQDLNWVKHFLFVFSLHSHIINVVVLFFCRKTNFYYVWKIQTERIYFNVLKKVLHLLTVVCRLKIDQTFI